MIKSMSCLFLLACLSLPCHARWGRTYEECVKFYGEPEKVWKSKDGKRIMKSRFRRSDERRDIRIITIFVEGRVANITYCCYDNSFMTTETIFDILQAYANEKQGVKFIPLEMVASPDTEDEVAAKKNILKESIKEQIWFLAGKKRAPTLYATFYRNAQMLEIKEINVNEEIKAGGQKSGEKKGLGF